MARRRLPLTPAQRAAKNEADRRRRRDHTIEFQRRQNAEMELRSLVETLKNENAHFRGETERLNDMVTGFKNAFEQQRELNQELRQKNLELEEIIQSADEWFDFDKEIGNNEPAAATEGPTTSQSGREIKEAKINSIFSY